tara:strand:- start:699 stop:968 length:270 start_codon:yes stop_codon:yes gene_type:complete
MTVDDLMHVVLSLTPDAIFDERPGGEIVIDVGTVSLTAGAKAVAKLFPDATLDENEGETIEIGTNLMTNRAGSLIDMDGEKPFITDCLT